MKNEPFVHVHISNLAAQTGVTRFTQIHDHWLYSKNESLQTEQLQEYTHLLLEAKSKYSPNLKAFTQSHIILDSIETFSQIAVNYKLMPPVRIKTKPAIFILERKDFREYPHGKIINGSVMKENFESDDNSKEESTVNVVDYNYESDLVSKEDKSEISVEQQDTEQVSEDNFQNIEHTYTDIDLDSESNTIVDEVETPLNPKEEPLVTARQAFDELKSLRQERKRKAIAKIKSETRKEVVASAKEKLKEIMKRHKHIADELSENIVSNVDEQEIDGRGDIPESDNTGDELQIEDDIIESEDISKLDTLTSQVDESMAQTLAPIEDLVKDKNENHTNENIDAIVEEVITRLIDRKIYDDKTKPEDIKAEDRQIIQRIVEEVVSERLNYSKSESVN